MAPPGRVQVAIAILLLGAALLTMFALEEGQLSSLALALFVWGLLLLFRDPITRQVVLVTAFTIACFCGWVGLLSWGFGAKFGVVMMIVAVFAAGVAWGLSGESVRQFFGLRCPYCRTLRVRPKIWPFRRVSCRECRHEWSSGPQRVDVSAFD